MFDESDPILHPSHSTSASASSHVPIGLTTHAHSGIRKPGSFFEFHVPMLSAFPPKSFTLNVPTRSHLYSHAFIINSLRLLWVVIAIGGELGAFFWSLAGCRWPSVDLGHKTRRSKVRPTHVLLVADPQVQHPALMAKGSWWANPVRRILFELHLRKSWHVTSRLRPHAVIFLGDMLANGKSAQSIEEYEQAAQKFKSIFSTDENTPAYYVPGNNDVGLGSVSSVAKNLRSFYAQFFGPLNQGFVISNHTFIGLDAPGLVDEDYHRHTKSVSFEEWKPIPDGPVAFVKQVAEYGPEHVILLSHIPLSRSETADCGPLREKGNIRRGAGPGYQSMLGRQTTHFLLKSLQPLMVFSADNRDYCEYTHILPGDRPHVYNQGNTIREVTVKSFSMSVHIKRPGFQLLSLVDPAKVANPDYASYADTPCLLPDQYRIYTSFYGPFLWITVIILFVLNFRGARARGLRKLDPLSLTPSPSSSGRSSPNPLIHPDPAQWSATWSPYTPISPRTSLPPYLRTPRSQSGSTATHLVASRPGTPGPSSPSSLTVPMPMPYRSSEDEEDDAMFPTQYAVRRDGYGHGPEEGWAHVGEHHHDRKKSEDYEVVHDQEAGGGALLGSSTSTGSVSAAAAAESSPRLHTEFISEPEYASSSLMASTSFGASRTRRTWTKSYTFVFRGRRRRITLGLPSWSSLHNLLDLFGFGPQPGLGLRRHRGGMTALTLDILSVFWPSVIVWVIINWTVL